MYEYSFYTDHNKPTLDKFTEEISLFMSALYNNGQITIDYSNIVNANGILKGFCIAIEKDSLSENMYNIYCRKFFAKIISLSTRPPDYTLIGETLDSSDVCQCENPSHYILFTTYYGGHEPISCGDCNLIVPLYRLPKTYDNEEYYDILCWAKEYRACDFLFMNSNIGERFGYRQISKPNSELTKEGMDICKRLENKTGSPFYYFLYRYYGKNKDICPICGDKWELNQALHGLYKYKCDKCKIISNGESR